MLYQLHIEQVSQLHVGVIMPVPLVQLSTAGRFSGGAILV